MTDNAYTRAALLRALADDCESTDGWEGAAGDLRASADLLEQLAITVRHVYAEKLPDTWFVCGAGKRLRHEIGRAIGLMGKAMDALSEHKSLPGGLS